MTEHTSGGLALAVTQLGALYGARDRPADYVLQVPDVELDTAVPALEPGGPSQTLQWVIPDTWHSLDPRLFRCFRRHHRERGYRSLVVEMRRKGRRGWPVWTEDEHRLDELFGLVAQLWQGVWPRPTEPEVPGLVVVEPDGAMPLFARHRGNAGLIRLLSQEVAITYENAAPACRRASGAEPHRSSVSQALALLEKQGLLAGEGVRRRPRRYISVAAEAHRRLCRHLEVPLSAEERKAQGVLTFRDPPVPPWTSLLARLQRAGVAGLPQPEPDPPPRRKSGT
jgi:hypothetical protein